MQSKYLVVSVRKSDGATFFPENVNHRKGIDNLSVAIEIATKKARNNSENYAYVVYKCTPLISVELDNSPIKINYL